MPRNSTGPRLIPFSRVGQRRQSVIPKRVFDALKLRPGDFLEVSAEGGRLHMPPKRLMDIADDRLTLEAAEKVRRGEASGGLQNHLRAGPREDVCGIFGDSHPLRKDLPANSRRL